MALRHARQYGARQQGLPHNLLASRHRRQRPRCRDAERRHRLTNNILPQHRPQYSASIAHAREGRTTSAFQLNVVAHTIVVDQFAEQDRPAIAELRHPGPKLMPGIRHGQRRGLVRHPVASQNRHALG